MKAEKQYAAPLSARFSHSAVEEHSIAIDYPHTAPSLIIADLPVDGRG